MPSHNHNHQHNHKLSKSTIDKVFGYRRRSMSSQKPTAQYAPPPQQLQQPQQPQQVRRPSHNPSPTVSASSSSSSMNLEPAPHVAEWCHQMHMIQNRKYEWCHGCHPRIVITPPNMPSEMVIQQTYQQREATHAYQ